MKEWKEIFKITITIICPIIAALIVTEEEITQEAGMAAVLCLPPIQ
jgi:hypothetical protein